MKLSKETWIIGIVAAVFVVIIGALIWKGPALVGGPTGTADPSVLVRADSHMTGKAGAKVTMVEFGDYECPACASVYPTLKRVTDSYKNNPDFNFVFRNFPLPQHKYAQPAAQAAEAAGAQGKYWEMHDALYRGWSNWEGKDTAPQTFVSYATNLGLDIARFQQEVNGKKYQSVISADLADTTKLSLDHTPTVFINGEEQVNLSESALKAKIDSLLK